MLWKENISFLCFTIEITNIALSQLAEAKRVTNHRKRLCSGISNVLIEKERVLLKQVSITIIHLLGHGRLLEFIYSFDGNCNECPRNEK